MKIFVHIKDQIFETECGSGCQRLQWLGDAAVHRYEHFYSVKTGMCRSLELEDGTVLEVDRVISGTLAEGAHVWVVLEEDEIAKKRNELSSPVKADSAQRSSRPASVRAKHRRQH